MAYDSDNPVFTVYHSWQSQAALIFFFQICWFDFHWIVLLCTSDYDWNSVVNENHPLKRNNLVVRLCQCMVNKCMFDWPTDLSLGTFQNSVVISLVSVFNISLFVMSSLAEVCTITFMPPFSKCKATSLHPHYIYSYDSSFYLSFSNAVMLWYLKITCTSVWVSNNKYSYKKWGRVYSNLSLVTCMILYRIIIV